MKGIPNKKITDRLDTMLTMKSDAIKIDNNPNFMAFNIDYLGKISVGGLAGCHIFAFSHYYKHPSGDMIPDPDMQVIYAPDNNLYPFTYQDSFGYQESYNTQTGNLRPRMQAEQAVFLKQWLKNVVDQQDL